MKMKKLAGLLGFLLVGSANATVISEVADAGDLLGTAQVVASGTTAITGSTSSGDVDLFNFGWSGGAFSTTVSGATSDPQLFLFDALGFGILSDDDSAAGRNPRISTSLNAGSYFLGINGYNNEAQSITGNIFNDGCCGTELPTGPGAGNPLSGWTGGGFAGNYTISFNSATTSVPEPGSLALLGLGLAGVGYFRRKKAA